ncbi:MAG: putative oxidoreductase (related to aryl-alcohol dehydrogenase) [uncultured archaeon A07HB70]|nr:MAG: putative oxidoreductase (related to aryl-alcohol dehydrogenase) [uncultured archaeon A07HB70]
MASANDMEYTTLGTTGVEVSRICLGCMSFGDPSWREWVLPPEEGHELVERALDLGVTFFDTANMYSKGESERVLGEALEGHRDEAVVATKGYFQMDEDNPNSGGLSRKALRQELAASAERLGGEPIDLYQIHRMDETVAPEHLLRTLDDAVRSGDVHHLGASSMWGHDLAETLRVAEREGLEPFVSMQDHHNLVYREGERETFPLCEREDLAVLPWSPLARGYLARPDDEVDATRRGESEERLYDHPYREGGGPTVNRRVERLAEERGVEMAQVALAWSLSKEFVTAPIVGTTSIDHLEDAVEALTLDLSDSDVEWLEEPYEAVRVSGHV